MSGFQIFKVAATGALAASIIVCNIQSATAAAKRTPEVESANLLKGKSDLQKYQKKEGERIAAVILAPQPLNPELPRQLQAVHKASLGLQPVINSTTESIARELIIHRNTPDSKAKQESKDAIIKLLIIRDVLVGHQRPLDDFIRGNVPAVPPGHVIEAPPGFVLRVLPRPIPPLQFGESPAYQQAVAISQTLKELIDPETIARDMSSPFHLSSKTEGLLQRLNQEYNGAVPNDLSAALRDARRRETEILDQLAAHDQLIQEHNSREPTPPKIPAEVSTVEEQRYWEGIRDDYTNNVAGPYNREADQLANTDADIRQKLRLVRDEMLDLRNRR